MLQLEYTKGYNIKAVSNIKMEVIYVKKAHLRVMCR